MTTFNYPLNARQLPPRSIKGCPANSVMNAGGGCDPVDPQTTPNNPPTKTNK